MGIGLENRRANSPSGGGVCKGGRQVSRGHGQ